MSDLSEGMVFRAPYPFIRTTYTEFDGDGSAEVQSWKPGIRYEHVGPWGDSDAFADGVGEIVLTVVSTHKPGRFPMRVFYTRKWTRPDGREFGKSRCHCAVEQKFRRLSRGYGFEYTVKDCGAAKAA